MFFKNQNCFYFFEAHIITFYRRLVPLFALLRAAAIGASLDAFIVKEIYKEVFSAQ